MKLVTAVEFTLRDLPGGSTCPIISGSWVNASGQTGTWMLNVFTGVETCDGSTRTLDVSFHRGGVNSEHHLHIKVDGASVTLNRTTFVHGVGVVKLQLCGLFGDTARALDFEN